MNIERLASIKILMSYQNGFGLETIGSKIFEFLWALVFVSPVIVSIFLIIAYVKYRKKYQWPLGRFLRYGVLRGLIGLVVALVYVVTWTIIYNSPQGPLGIFFFAPPLFAVGELAGFGLFAWLVARKRKRLQGEV